MREELQSGYTLFDRLLRPAMVRVAVPAAEEPEVESEEPEAESEEPETD